MSPYAEAEIRALQKHPDCLFARSENGLDFMFNRTIVVNLWRNEETWAAGDPPRHVVQGFYP